MDWIPAAEAMPDKPGTLLVRLEAVGRDAETVERGVRHEAGWLIDILFGDPWHLPDDDPLWRVTHWAPWPQP